MSSSFVNTLRNNGKPLTLGGVGQNGNTLKVRAQVLEAWDAIRVDASPSASVRSLKELALRELYPDPKHAADFMVKLSGYEVLDEDAPLSSTGARDGSTFLITDRRRRPVE